jgi:hypothetical protein
MKKTAIIYALFALSANAAESTDEVVLKNVIDKLDLTSFNNSIGPRREKGKVTFKDYGISVVTLDDKKAVITKPDNTWKFTVTLLYSKSGQTEICFEDQAMNGGSYHSQNAYSLKADESGWLMASPSKESACQEFAK